MSYKNPVAIIAFFPIETQLHFKNILRILRDLVSRLQNRFFYPRLRIFFFEQNYCGFLSEADFCPHSKRIQLVLNPFCAIIALHSFYYNGYFVRIIFFCFCQPASQEFLYFRRCSSFRHGHFLQPF